MSAAGDWIKMKPDTRLFATISIGTRVFHGTDGYFDESVTALKSKLFVSTRRKEAEFYASRRPVTENRRIVEYEVIAPVDLMDAAANYGRGHSYGYPAVDPGHEDVGLKEINAILETPAAVLRYVETHSISPAADEDPELESTMSPRI